MTKQQVIDILEAYKPSGNIYNGYNSIEEKVDEKICSLIDEIIESVKREPDGDNIMINCSDGMPEESGEYLVLVEDIPYCTKPIYETAIYDSKENAFGEYVNVFEYEPIVKLVGEKFEKNENVIAWFPLPDPPNCKNCKWHDDFSCVCSNGYSDECEDFTDNNFYCEYWETK